MEAFGSGGLAGSGSCGKETAPYGTATGTGESGSEPGSSSPWVRGRSLDFAPRSQDYRTADRGAVSPGPCLEAVGVAGLDGAEAGPAGQRAEPGEDCLLEESELAGAKKNAARLRAWIFFQDESGFTQQPSVRTTWGPRGKTPVLRARGNHWSKTSVAAALGFRWDGRRTRLLARTKPGSFNTASLILFLQQLKRFVRGQKVILVWDRLPAHRSTEMGFFLWAQRSWLQIAWLPAYAPDLNPTEGVWNNIKGREMANLCPDQMPEAVSAFRRGLRRVSHTARLPHSFLAHAGLSF